MKKFVLMVCALWFCTGANAQLNVSWEDGYVHTGTAGYSSEARYVTVDATGNIYTISDHTSDMDPTNHPVTTTRYYVILRKYDFAGNFINQALIDVTNMPVSGFDYKSTFALDKDAQGNLYVGYTVYNNTTNYDVAVAKYSPSLALLWQKTYAAAGVQTGVGLVLNSGSAVCCFKSVVSGNTSYGFVSLSGGAGIASAFYTFAANNYVVNSMVAGGSKVFYVTGHKLVSGTKNVLTACITIGVGLKWETTFNNGSVANDDWGNDIVVGSDNNLYVLGTGYTNASNGNDGLIIKYNTSGVYMGFQPLNQTTTDVGYTLINGTSGYVFAACANTTSVKVYRVSLSNLGIIAQASWQVTPASQYNSITGVNVSDVKMAGSGNVYVTGAVTATSATGNFTASYLSKFGYNGILFKNLANMPVEGENASCYSGVGLALDQSHGNSIIWLRSNWSTNTTHAAEASIVTSIASGTVLRQGDDSQPAVSDNGMAVYPNPATQSLYINAPSITGLVLVNAIGKTVASYTGIVPGMLDVSTLPRGVYFARMTGGDNTLVKKIVLK